MSVEEERLKDVANKLTGLVPAFPTRGELGFQVSDFAVYIGKRTKSPSLACRVVRALPSGFVAALQAAVSLGTARHLLPNRCVRVRCPLLGEEGKLPG